MHRTIAALLTLTGLAILQPASAAEPVQTTPLLSRELGDLPNKEVVMLTVEYRPGQSSLAHRHNAHTFVYVLEGALMMGVKGKNPVRVEVGQTFYESPTDIHSVARNASDTAPAKFLVFFVKDTGTPITVPVE